MEIVGKNADDLRVQPLVSVITLTCNQERFLPACLESIRAQKGEFDLEHIIVDDASTDQTPAILEAYRGWFPDSTTILRSKKNQGANTGMKAAYARCQGLYVALCEGDDLWIAPDKLKIQVELMRKRPDLAMCYHDAVVLREDKREWPQIMPGFGAPIQTIEDLLDDNKSHTCTVMYRRIPGLEFPDWYTQFTIGDWPNHVFHAQRGGIGYVGCPLSAYRVHDKGSWSGMAEANRIEELCGMLKNLDGHLMFRFSKRIEATMARIRGAVSAQAA